MATQPAGSVQFAVRAPLARDDLAGLYARVCTLLTRTGPMIAICDVTGVPADAVAADALARLQLAAHRHGCQMQLVGLSAELRELIAFIGLSEVLPEAL